jgi:tRNA threonylcarbamoyladenosine biosynthesis protein TsaE
VRVHDFSSPEALEDFAERLVPKLPPGAVLILVGEMGAGKTTFTKGLARGLGFTGEVTSPTYTYIHQLPTPMGELVHIDAYRLTDARKLWGMGLEELLETARLTVVEWGESLIPDLDQPVVIRFAILENARQLRLETPSGTAISPNV